MRRTLTKGLVALLLPVLVITVGHSIAAVPMGASPGPSPGLAANPHSTNLGAGSGLVVNANCTASPISVEPGETVTLDASNTTDASYVEFDYDGDGDYDVRDDDDFIVNVSYRVEGTYEPIVRAVGQINDTASCGTIYVGNQPPSAEYTYEPSNPVVGVPVTFDGTNSSDPDGNITAYEWFVDGEKIGEGAVINHTFANATTYRVALIVTDDDNESAREVRYVTVEPNEPPTAAIEASPTPATTGQPVTLDASDSTDPDGEIVEYRWDVDGDGTIDAVTTEPNLEWTYSESGTVTAVVTVVDSDGATDTAEVGFEVTQPRDEPQAACSVSPTDVEPDQVVVIDARETTNATYVEVDVDGDGTYDRTVEGEFRIEVQYDEPGTYEPRVRAINDRGSAAPLTDTAVCGEVVVEANEPPVASFTVDPSSPVVNQTVTLDGTNSTDADGEVVEYRWDVDGDGTIDVVTDEPTTTYTPDEPGNVSAVLVVVDDDGATDEATRQFEVQPPGPTLPDLLEGIILPLVLGGGLSGLLGLLWLVYRRPRGPDKEPRRTRYPKPKPGVEPSDVEYYAAGTFEVPAIGTSTVSVTDVGFEPDLVLLTTTNASRIDAFPERSESWATGVAMRVPNGIEQHTTVVADDASSTDQATVSMSDGDCLGAIRHGVGPPTRIRGRVVATTPAGFEVAVGVEGQGTETGRVGVLYQAFNLPYEVEVETGHFRTPAEPGIQAIELGIDADHVMLTASSAVADLDRLWTTDRSVGRSMGLAVGRDAVRQTVRNGTAWPGHGAETMAFGGVDQAIHLTYLSGDRIAGRTTASVLELGDRLVLQYDRLYSGPEKIGWTDPHVVSYLAMNTAEMLRPDIGVFRLPAPGESGTVDLGFTPGMVEFATPGVGTLGRPDSTTALTGPFASAHGVAVAREGRLSQYVLQGTGAATPPPGPTVHGAVDPTAGESAVGEVATDGSGDAVNATADGRVAVSLPVDEHGVITGRDDLRVEAFTEAGFEVAVESVSTDDRTPDEETRPYVFYRAWPAVGGTESHASMEQGTDDDRPQLGTGTGNGTSGGA